MKSQSYIISIIPCSFLLLWGLAVVLKLQDVPQWQRELNEQVFPASMADILLWLLPAVQIVLLLLLLYRPTVRLGMRLSTLLVSTFTIYLIMGVANIFGRVPCACGGIWPSNEHWLHIALNSLFIILGILYWVLAHRSRPAGDVLPDVARKEGTTAS